MEQYKVILVDDEVEVIDVMKKKIRWDDLGFDVVGSATNGVKALELVEKLQPDVVLTDIKMPYMDGLELARKLNQDYPNIYIMLCTGFDEFEYAKEAVHLEIKEYMLKKYKDAQKENGYWLNNMDEYFYTGIDNTKDYEKLVNSITAKEVQDFLAKLLKQNNEIQVIMTVPEENK